MKNRRTIIKAFFVLLFVFRLRSFVSSFTHVVVLLIYLFSTLPVQYFFPILEKEREIEIKREKEREGEGYIDRDRYSVCGGSEQ